MKSEDQFQSQIEFKTLDFTEAKQHSLKCIKGNEAFEYCTNQNCSQQRIFFCESKKCPCRQKHKPCLKADLGYTFQMIQSKINDTSSMKQQIYSLFDRVIDQLSQIRDEAVALINQQIKYQKLHQIEMLFMKQVVEDGNYEKFTAKESAKLWNAVNGKLIQNFDALEQITSQMNKFHETVSKNGEDIKKTISKIFKKQQLIKAVNGEKNLSWKDAFMVYSSIVSEDMEIERLLEMFPRQIKTVELLIKGSDHEFNVKPYFDLYGQSTDVMVLCKTDYDKIVGGYTPLSFNPGPEQEGFVADDSKQSFIFSLSQNDKFELVQQKKAIYRDCTNVILTFGNAELEICNKANEIRKSCTYLTNQSYSNPKYSENKESFLKLNGSDCEEFLVKEWEVWKVHFKVDQSKQQGEKDSQKLQAD